MSQTTLVARMSSCASAIARTSAWVISPRLGSDWANASSGLPKSRWRLARLARSGRLGSRIKIITLSGLKSMRRQVGELGLGHPLVGRAQVFADIGPKIVDPAVQKLSGQPRRRTLVAREQADLLGGPDPVDDRLDRPARQAGQIRVLPAFLDAGERQLHAADVRHDLEEIFAQPIAEIAGDPVEKRIAAGDQHRMAIRERLAHLAQGHAHIGLESLLPRRAPTRAATGSRARPGSGRPTSSSRRAGSVKPARPSSPIPRITSFDRASLNVAVPVFSASM